VSWIETKMDFNACQRVGASGSEQVYGERPVERKRADCTGKGQRCMSVWVTWIVGTLTDVLVLFETKKKGDGDKNKYNEDE